MVVLTGVEQENIPHVLYLNTVSVILRVLLEPNDCSGYYGKKYFFSISTLSTTQLGSRKAVIEMQKK